MVRNACGCRERERERESYISNEKKCSFVRHSDTHTQGNLINEINKADEISLYISMYITDRLLI